MKAPACSFRFGLSFNSVLLSLSLQQNTALHLAAQEGHSNVIEYLLTSGAEFKINKQQQTFMDMAIKHKQQTALMTVLTHERYENNSPTCLSRVEKTKNFGQTRWEEAMDLHSVEYKTPFIGIIQMSSEVAQAVMERCVTKNQVNELNSCEKIFTV